jgi:hypothetical protein
MEFWRKPALDPISDCAIIGWASLHVGALAAAWGTRIAAGSRFEVPAQLACFFAMAAVGGAAWICRVLDLGLWIVSGITLVAMVLTAVIDFRRSHEVYPPISTVASS